MFQFRRFPTLPYLIQITLTVYCTAGFPHSDISGSTLICSSPKLFAAYHVLHRLLMPRHSPCALLRLTFVRISVRFVGISIRSTPFPPQASGLRQKLCSASLFLLPNSNPLRWALNLYTGLKSTPALSPSIAYALVENLTPLRCSAWSSNLEKSTIGSLVQNYAGSCLEVFFS